MHSSPPHFPPAVPRAPRSSRVWLVVGIFFGTLAVATGSAAWWYSHYFKPAPFKPVALSATEQQTLNSKLESLDGSAKPGSTVPADQAKTIVLTEREINGWLAGQAGLGETVKVHLQNDTMAASVLVPVDPSVPYVGGRTLRIKVAFNTLLDQQRHFNLSLADVSVGGISLPNAWLNGAKGLNILADNGPGSPNQKFLQQFSAGIKDFKIHNGELRMVLND